MIVGWPGLHQDNPTENRSSAAEFILQNVALRGFYVPHQLYVQVVTSLSPGTVTKRAKLEYLKKQ